MTASDIPGLRSSAPSPGEIVSAFGLPGAPRSLTPLAGAWSHRVFRLVTTRGAYAVKQLMDPWGDSHWREWLAEAWEFELAAFDAGVSMPRPRPTRTGGCLADVQSVDGATHVPVRVHDWVDARPCPPGPVEARVARAIGAERAAAVSVSVGRIGELYEAAETTSSGMPMSHGDVDQKNLLLTDRMPVLCDWDVATPLRPTVDLLRTAMSLAAWERPDVARATITAYRDAGGDDEPVRPGDLAVDLVVGLDWLVFSLERATGLRECDAQRQAETRRALPAMLAKLPHKVNTALTIDSWLDGA